VARVIFWVSRVFTVITLVLGAIVVANITKLLEVKGWDKFLLEYWPDFIYFVKLRFFWVVALFLFGVVAIASWVVILWKEKVFEIIKAEYGTTNEIEDVTEKLKSMIKDNKLEFIVLNEILGVHPDPGTRKSLSIKYKFNGKTIKYECRERDRVVIL